MEKEVLRDSENLDDAVGVVHFGAARVVAGRVHRVPVGRAPLSNLSEALRICAAFWEGTAGSGRRTVTVYTDGKVNAGWLRPSLIAREYTATVPVEFRAVGGSPDAGLLAAVHTAILEQQSRVRENRDRQAKP